MSSHKGKDDLERQKQLLEFYCARQGWTFEIGSLVRRNHMKPAPSKQEVSAKATFQFWIGLMER